MRKIHIVLATLLVTGTLCAQSGVSLRFNISQQPVWGPTGYDRVDYYYLPDVEAYYNVPEHKFYYIEGGRWVGRSRLPSRYRDFDLYSAHKVVVTGRKPYRHYESDREKYFSYRDNHDQEAIRDSRDSKYWEIRDHPNHDKWERHQRGESNYDNSTDQTADRDNRDNNNGNWNNNYGMQGDQLGRDQSTLGANINQQPVWGPTGYDRADYYYLPDIDVYYSVNERQYIYQDGSNWRHRTTLPAKYNGYNLYNSYKVVLNEDQPYQNNESNREKYRGMKGKRDQPVIRDSHDSKYLLNKDLPYNDGGAHEQEP